MESKLPVDTLGRIWDLADQDNDGMLNRPEFIVVSNSIIFLFRKPFINSIKPVTNWLTITSWVLRTGNKPCK